MHQFERMAAVLRTIDAGDLETAILMLARSANPKKRRMAREAFLVMAQLTPDRVQIITDAMNGGGSLRHPQSSMKPVDDFIGSDHNRNDVRKDADSSNDHQQSSLHGDVPAAPDASSS